MNSEEYLSADNEEDFEIQAENENYELLQGDEWQLPIT